MKRWERLGWIRRGDDTRAMLLRRQVGGERWCDGKGRGEKSKGEKEEKKYE